MTEYVLGNAVRCSTTFTNTSGSAADPTAVVFKYMTPAGATTTYNYGTDAELVKDSVGNYHVDVSVNAEGTWYYRFAGTGAVEAADEGSFIVKDSKFF